MSKKDLRWSSSDVPALLLCYADAHERVFGKRPFVHEKYYGRFSVFEDDLREMGYSYREYAYTVVRILKKWADSKGLKSIPVNVFTGDWALGKFKRIAGSKYVDISNIDVDDEIYWSEMTVARSYIQAHAYDREPVSVRSLAKELGPLLSPHWLARYRNGGDRMTDRVLDDLCREYGLNHARNYNSIVDAIIHGDIRLQSQVPS